MVLAGHPELIYYTLLVAAALCAGAAGCGLAHDPPPRCGSSGTARAGQPHRPGACSCWVSGCWSWPCSAWPWARSSLLPLLELLPQNFRAGSVSLRAGARLGLAHAPRAHLLRCPTSSATPAIIAGTTSGRGRGSPPRSTRWASPPTPSSGASRTMWKAATIWASPPGCWRPSPARGGLLAQSALSTLPAKLALHRKRYLEQAMRCAAPGASVVLCRAGSRFAALRLWHAALRAALLRPARLEPTAQPLPLGLSLHAEHGRAGGHGAARTDGCGILARRRQGGWLAACRRTGADQLDRAGRRGGPDRGRGQPGAGPTPSSPWASASWTAATWPALRSLDGRMFWSYQVMNLLRFGVFALLARG